jgi:uncharacterized protein
MQLRFDHDREAARYLVWIEDDDSGRPAGLISYRDQGSARDLAHTEVRPDLQGQGIAGRLAAFAIADIRDSGMELIPGCPYIYDYVVRHPDDQQLVPAAWRAANSL